MKVFVSLIVIRPVPSSSIASRMGCRFATSLICSRVLGRQNIILSVGGGDYGRGIAIR
jgi:hypothetical protein